MFKTLNSRNHINKTNHIRTNLHKLKKPIIVNLNSNHNSNLTIKINLLLILININNHLLKYHSLKLGKLLSTIKPKEP